MNDFNILYGRSTELFINGKLNPNLIIEEGCWYLCTDTAELFLGISTIDENGQKVLTLKLINEISKKFITESELAAYNFITETELANKGYITDVSDKADKEHSHEEYALAEHEHTEYAEVAHEHEQYLTEQSLAGYATEQYVIEVIAAQVPVEDLVKKEEVQDIKTKLESEVLPTVQETIIPVVQKVETEIIPTVQELAEKAATQEWVEKQSYVTENALTEAINNIEHPIEGLATEEFVNKKIAEAQLTDKEVDLAAYYTKSEVDALIPNTSNLATKEEVAAIENKIPSIEGFATETYVNNKVAEIKVPTKVSELINDAGFITAHQDISHLATKQELADAISSIEHPVIDLTNYATEDYVKTVAYTNKYEILPIEGLFVAYGDTEIRVNTQHVDIDSLPTQEANDGSSGTYYYMTFRAYAPEGATSVIEGSSDKMDTEHSTLVTDKYGRKYTTIWSAIASKSGNTWTKFGDKSTIDKYLGFYYNFHWYAGDTLISKDKVRVILTNDACHNDLVPDAVARRIDDKVAIVNSTINNLNTTVENIENNYVQNETLENYVTNEYIQTQNYVTNNYIEQHYTTTETLEATYATQENVAEVVTQQIESTLADQIESKVTEVIEIKIEDGTIVTKAESISYDTF